MSFQKGIVYFGATWCQPCKAVKKLLGELTGVPIQYFDIEKHPDITVEYGVTSVPTVFTINDGHVVNKYVGLFTKTDKLLKDLE